MRIRHRQTVPVTLTILAALLSTTPLVAQCDELEPALVTFDFDPKVVDVTGGPQAVVVTLQVTDDVAGVDRIGMSFISPTANQNRGCNADTPTSGTPNDGTYSCTVTFDGNPEQGAWLVDRVSVVDKVGRSESLDTGELTLRGLPTVLQVTSIEDIEAPMLTNLTVSPAAVDVSSGPQPVTCSMTLTDNLTGVTGMTCQVDSPTDVHGTSCVALFPTSGTPQNGTFECDLIVPRYAEAGSWPLEVTLSDGEGNRRVYVAADLAALSLPDEISVTSAPVDLSPPTLIDFDLAPPSVNVENGDATVTCSGRITDDLAGTVSLGCTATYIDLSFRVVTQACADVEIDSGTPLDGTWSCDLPIPQYSPGGTWDVIAIVFDALGNSQAYDGETLDGLGFPSSFDVECGTGSGGLSPSVLWSGKQLLTWNPIPGAILYEPYGGDLASLTDLDANGLPDAGYGACRFADDPNLTDTMFTDSSDPLPGSGEFILIGYRTLLENGLGLGTTSDSLDRTPTAPCP